MQGHEILTLALNKIHFANLGNVWMWKLKVWKLSLLKLAKVTTLLEAWKRTDTCYSFRILTSALECNVEHMQKLWCVNICSCQNKKFRGAKFTTNT